MTMTSADRNVQPAALDAALIEKFQTLLELEFEARTAKAAVDEQPAGAPLDARQRMYEAWRAAQHRLYVAVDDLTPAETAAYGPYRAAVLADLPEPDDGR